MDTDRLITIVGKLRENKNIAVLDELQDVLNLSESRCTDVIFTENTDKLPFGVMVIPNMDTETIRNLLIDGTVVGISSYMIELDSRMFSCDLSDEEITSIILYNVYHMTNGTEPIERLRSAIDLYFMKAETQLQIKESLQYNRILAFGLVDTLIQYTNCLYKDSDIVNDAYMISIGMGDAFGNAISKLFNDVPGFDNSFSYAKLIILDWCFRLYNNVEHNRIPAIKQLERCKDLTASVLYKRCIDKVIVALHRIDTDDYINESYNILMEGKKNSLFSQIKYNGLRGLEDDFYEFMVLARNAETEQEVLYALKQINVRLSILDDYLRKEDLDETDKKRWNDLYNKYCTIRDEIAKKKVYNKRNYGVFFDYNQLDDEDE